MSCCTFLYLLAIFVGLIFLFIKWKQSYWKRKGVEYVKPDFFFGNTKSFLTQTKHRCELFEDFYNYFKSRGKKFGGVYDFLEPQLVITDLELAKCVLQTDFSHFKNHQGYINEDADPISGNLFNLKDEKWKNIRAKLTPTFTTGKIKMMFETMIDSTLGLQKLLDGYASVNDPVDIKKILLLFTTDIIGSVAFGLNVNSMENPETEFRKKFAKLFNISPAAIFKRFLSLALPKWLLVKLRFRVTKKEIEDFFVKVVKDIVEYREKNNIFRKDFMHLLIQIKNTGEARDDEDLKAKSEIKHLSITEMAAQCVTFFVAGFETSSTTMTFAFLELALNQNIQNKLREEIQAVVKKHNNQLTYDGIMEMEYLDMVFQETLRKHSAAPAISRECNKAYTIPDTDIVIEPGTLVMIPVYGVQKDPKYYPDPNEFDPERFNKENKKNIPPFAYLPFGEGPRACIGLRFGKIQSKVGICAVLLKYKVTLNKKTRLPITYESSRIPAVKGGVWLNLEKL